MFNQKGVTLIELMISLAVIAILITAVSPSIQSILIKNRIVGEINEVSAVIQFARNNAIDEQMTTSMCPSADYSMCTTNWADPKIVFFDADNDGNRGANEELLAATAATSKNNTLSSTTDTLIFAPSGQANQNSSILFCFKGKQAEYARALTVTLQGRVKASNDSNRDGVHEDSNGVALSCS